MSVLRAAQRWIAVAAAVISFDTAAALTGVIPLYDAAGGVLPDAPPWSWIYFADASGSTQSMMASPHTATVLDTRSSGGRAGYYTVLGTALDSTAGFTLDFSLRLGAESHDRSSRSGFSIIVLDQAKNGVELSFWTDEVFAKNADIVPGGDYLTHGEGIPVDTQTALRGYRLTFQSGGYTLATAGATQLAGPLRYYAPFVDFPYNIMPYGQANYIFFGDNTTSASALVELGSITLAPVPEPAEWALMAVGLGCVAGVVRRRRRAMSGAV